MKRNISCRQPQWKYYLACSPIGNNNMPPDILAFRSYEPIKWLETWAETHNLDVTISKKYIIFRDKETLLFQGTYEKCRN